jgi:hypothetical protein
MIMALSEEGVSLRDVLMPALEVPYCEWTDREPHDKGL